MRSLIRSSLVILLISLFSQSYAAISQQNQDFIQMLVPKIQQANEQVLAQRNELVRLHDKYQKGKTLSKRDQHTLEQLAKDYKIDNATFTDEKTWQTAYERIDAIPTSLVLAQAINESAWGRSRFAREGNNYFGQWCYTAGCGIVPKQRPAGKTYEVKKYQDASESIANYIHNLNTNAAYQQLRDLRGSMRAAGKPLDGDQLATGLVHYSTRAQAYVNSLQSLIARYDLELYDHHTASMIAQHQHKPLVVS